jgi:RNA polymerase sigma-70 factor (ECF subfamily)
MAVMQSNSFTPPFYHACGGNQARSPRHVTFAPQCVMHWLSFPFMTADAHSPTLRDIIAAGGFHTTRWTQVIQAKERTGDGLDALRDLCAAYYAPVIAFLRRRGHATDEARDLAHEFFEGVLEGDAIGGAERVQGRFRSYLLGAVKHFLAHRREWEQRLRRGAGEKPLSIDAASPDSPALEVPDEANLSPEAAFDRRWAVTVLARAMDALAQECVAEGKAELLAKTKPWLVGEAAHGDQGAVAESLGMSAGALKVALHRLKLRYRRLVKAEVASTLQDESVIEDEMRALFAALGG